jgi:hypothetical protein
MAMSPRLMASTPITSAPVRGKRPDELPPGPGVGGAELSDATAVAWSSSTHVEPWHASFAFASIPTDTFTVDVAPDAIVVLAVNGPKTSNEPGQSALASRARASSDVTSIAKDWVFVTFAWSVVWIPG